MSKFTFRCKRKCWDSKIIICHELVNSESTRASFNITWNDYNLWFTWKLISTGTMSLQVIIVSTSLCKSMLTILWRFLTKGLNVILLNMIIFGYHSGTQNTQNCTCVRHLKWGWLGRGHFELYGIRQQVLTITIIMKKSALPSSFRKYLTLRSYLAFLTMYLQINVY